MLTLTSPAVKVTSWSPIDRPTVGRFGPSGPRLRRRPSLAAEPRAERRLQLGQGPGRHQDLGVSDEGVASLDVPQGQPVGVGGHQSHPGALGGDAAHR